MKLTDEQVIRVPKDQLIFDQNTPGGDVYIVESGQVLLRREWNGQITESLVQQTEILSGLTCLTNEPRLHSARAVEDSVLKKVKWDILQRHMKHQPRWFRKLLMFYSDSIHDLHRKQINFDKRIDELEKTQITIWYTLRQFLTLVLNIFQEAEDHGRDRCYIHELEQKGSSLLCVESHKIKKIVQTLIEAGVFLTHLDTEHGNIWVKPQKKDRVEKLLDVCSQMKVVAQELKSSPPPRVLRIVSSLLIYIHKMDLLQTEKVSLPLLEIKESLQALVGQEVLLEHLEEAQKYRLLTIESSSDGLKLRLVPQTVGVKVSCFSALKSLEKLQRTYKQSD